MLSLPKARKGESLVARVTTAIRRAIHGGRFSAADRLPSSRALADSLGVSRKTVVLAFAQLQYEGLVRTEKARGTYVATRVQQHKAALPRPVAASLLRTLSDEDWPQDLRLASTGAPDTRLAIQVDFARNYRGVLSRFGKNPRWLDYGDPRGAEKLRVALAQYLKKNRGLHVSADEILITRGSQMALYLSAHIFAKPRTVAVEALGYSPAWSAFSLAGHALTSVAVENDGMAVADIPCAMPEPGIVYVTPHRQYPTTVSLSREKREHLLRIAARRGDLIIEDDYDHEYYFDGLPIAPLAADTRGAHILHVGSFSKLLAPALRIGYLVAHRDWIERLARLRVVVDRQGDTVAELAMAELLESGAMEQHQRRARKLYRTRRDCLQQLLTENFADEFFWSAPHGGLTFWIGADRSIDTWIHKLRTLRVHVATTRDFSFDKKRIASRAFRLGFGAFTEKELEQTVDLLQRAWRR